MHQCTASGGCERCERSQDIPAGGGRLLLHVPVRHLRSRVTDALDACGDPWQVQEDDRNGGRVYAVTTRDVMTLATALLPRLSGEELLVVRAMFEPAGTAASHADYFASRAVGTLLQRTRQRWLADLLDDRRLVSHFQPVVMAGSPHDIYGYECLMRGRRPGDDAELIYPDELLAAAHDADLLFPLDLAARLAAIQGAATHGIREAVFINFSPAAIYDPAFCLRSTIAAVSAAGLSPEQIVFEVTESERVPSNPGHLI
ncbi:MAG: EAL domain-containing protein, partial [Polaromonas sp.]|nr:EAL domain-containing protein [Gemmatimonadaceae bacterium]